MDRSQALVPFPSASPASISEGMAVRGLTMLALVAVSGIVGASNASWVLPEVFGQYTLWDLDSAPACGTVMAKVRRTPIVGRRKGARRMTWCCIQ
jgi:hypothetical protein